MNLPPIGLGTMGVEDSAVIETALDVGYRHLDTARIYDNEAVVGAGLDDSSVSRESVTVATKLWVDDLGADDVGPAATRSCELLGVDSIDLLYVHRPRGAYDPSETLPVLDELVDDGLVSHVGVSNFTVDQLRAVRDHLDAPIAAHQVERHPLFVRDDVLEDARTHDYQLVAYSPLSGGRVRDLDELRTVADRHETTPEAIAIAWLVGTEAVVTVPKASTRAHLEANLAAGDLELSTEDRRLVESVTEELELYPE